VEQDRASTVVLYQADWRVQPLVRYEVIVNVIAATTIRKEPTVRAEFDPAYTKRA
jgi:hypothetical protein